MATPKKVLWIDASANKLWAGWNAFVPLAQPVFKQGETVDFLVHLVEKPNTYEGQMTEMAFEGGSTISLTVGKKNERPIGGFFYLTYGSSTTQPIAFDVDADALEYTLNTTPSIISAGGVYVDQTNSDVFKVTFRNNGTRTLISGNGMSLSPTSNVVIKALALGDTNTKAVFTIALRQAPVSSQVGSWAVEAPCVASVSQLKPDTCDISLSSQPKDGYFMLAIGTNPAIPVSVFASESTLQNALGGDLTVSKEGDYLWRIKTVSGANLTATITSSDEIVSFSGMTCQFTIGSEAAIETLSGTGQITATLEVNYAVGSVTYKVLSTPCTIIGSVNN